MGAQQHHHLKNCRVPGPQRNGLPLKWGAAATLDSEDLNFDPDASSPNVTFVPGQGVLLRFNMNQNPAARQLVSGEIHLHWKNATAPAVRRVQAPPGRPISTATNLPKEKEEGVEESYEELEKSPVRRTGACRPDLCSYLRANLTAALPTCPPTLWDLASLTLTGFFYRPDLAVGGSQAQRRASCDHYCRPKTESYKRH